MKGKWYLSALLVVLLSSSACTADPIPSSPELSSIEKLQQKYTIDEDGNVRDYMSTLNLTCERGENYEILSDGAKSEFHYYVMDDYGNVMDEGYHDWLGSFNFSTKDGLLELDYGFGSMFWQKRYYDVSNGRVSRFFSKPVQTHGELVAYFTTKDESLDWVLVIQNMFDPAVYYKEIIRDFSLYVYTAPSTAEFLDDGKKLSITYWLKPDDREVTEIIDLM